MSGNPEVDALKAKVEELEGYIKILAIMEPADRYSAVLDLVTETRPLLPARKPSGGYELGRWDGILDFQSALMKSVGDEARAFYKQRAACSPT